MGAESATAPVHLLSSMLCPCFWAGGSVMRSLSVAYVLPVLLGCVRCQSASLYSRYCGDIFVSIFLCSLSPVHVVQLVLWPNHDQTISVSLGYVTDKLCRSGF